MKITLNVTKAYHQCHEVLIDGLPLVEIYDLNESPEDAIIGRGLVDGDDIIRFMKLAYEAGKKQEEFQVEIQGVTKFN
jgi:hypothetical protein